MDSPMLIPRVELLTTKVQLSDSDSEEEIQSAQRSPASKGREDRIKLEEDTFKALQAHTESLKGIQISLIQVAEEIKKIDGLTLKKCTPKFLAVTRPTPRLPGKLNQTGELVDAFASIIDRAERRLCAAWRRELSVHAQRLTERF